MAINDMRRMGIILNQCSRMRNMVIHVGSGSYFYINFSQIFKG
ncbi:hypothetical protein E6C60_3342 [Paenibacillus algicola]|uniref:Uncharacterized protein n=1 Tax=Paenibacillus algicola TaxID=2565926 RepID=A0A4P8XNP0_9BACL|nr:hypothetical protein E6C60_3342 [Paenibacillus algicola]